MVLNVTIRSAAGASPVDEGRWCYRDINVRREHVVGEVVGCRQITTAYEMDHRSLNEEWDGEWVSLKT